MPRLAPLLREMPRSSTVTVFKTPARLFSWRRLLLAAICVAGIIAVTYCDLPTLATLRQWSEHLGPHFPWVFWLFYVLITQFPIPRTIFTLSSGILFGPWVGIFIALSATAVSAAISLSMVRELLGNWVRPRLTHPAVTKINERLALRGWLAVLSLRMIAGVPFSILNYAAAFSSVRLLPFVFATFLGSAPGTIATVVFGDTLAGSMNPKVMMVSGILLLLGIFGLWLDSRIPLPEKNQSDQ